MNREEIIQAVKDIITTIAPDEDLSSLTEGERLRDQIELDSMDFLDIVMELRKRYGTEDDDELILRALVPEADLEKMRAAGAVRRDFPLLASPELEKVRKLMALSRSNYVEVKSAEMSLILRRN